MVMVPCQPPRERVRCATLPRRTSPRGGCAAGGARPRPPRECGGGAPSESGSFSPSRWSSLAPLGRRGLRRRPTSPGCRCAGRRCPRHRGRLGHRTAPTGRPANPSCGGARGGPTQSPSPPTRPPAPPRPAPPPPTPRASPTESPLAEPRPPGPSWPDRSGAKGIPLPPGHPAAGQDVRDKRAPPPLAPSTRLGKLTLLLHS